MKTTCSFRAIDRPQINLTRPIQPLPGSVRDALQKNGLVAACRARPAYQQNDYISWIAGARRQQTRQKRLDQMLDELRAGGIYMGMDHRSSRRR